MKYNLIQKTIFTTKIQGKGNEIQNNKRKQAGTKRGQKEIIIGKKTMGKITLKDHFYLFIYLKVKQKISRIRNRTYMPDKTSNPKSSKNKKIRFMMG